MGATADRLLDQVYGPGRPCLHSHRQDTSGQSEFCSGVPPLHYSAMAPTVGGGTHRKATAVTVHCVNNTAAKFPQMVGVIHAAEKCRDVRRCVQCGGENLR